MIPFCCGIAPSAVVLQPWCIVNIRFTISGLCALVVALVLVGGERVEHTCKWGRP